MKTKRIGSLFLGAIAAAALAVAMLVSPAFALETNAHCDAYAGGTYTSFGDSISTGYSNTEYSWVRGYDNISDRAYPVLLTKTLGMSGHCCCNVGYRTNEALRSLGIEVGHDNDVYFDIYTEGDWKDGTAPDVDTVKGYVRESQLITIDLGGADLVYAPYLTAASNTLTSQGYEKYAEIMDEIAAQPSAAQFAETISTMKTLGYYDVFLNELTAEVCKGVISYKKNYDKLLEELRSENPDATIVIVGLYSPFVHLSVADNAALEGIINTINSTFDAANAYLKIEAKKYDCAFADVSETESPLSKSISGVELSENEASYDPHPTTEGNIYMAQQIISALPHNYSAEVVAPTCTKKGYTLHTCACGDTYKDTYTSATGHTWEKSKVVKPTWHSLGYTKYVCSTCGKTKKAYLKAA